MRPVILVSGILSGFYQPGTYRVGNRVHQQRDIKSEFFHHQRRRRTHRKYGVDILIYLDVLFQACVYLLLGAYGGVVMRRFVESHVVAFSIVREPVHQRQGVGVGLGVERKFVIAYPPVVTQAFYNVIQHAEGLIIRVDINICKFEFTAARLLYRLVGSGCRRCAIVVIYLGVHDLSTLRYTIGTAAGHQQSRSSDNCCCKPFQQFNWFHVILSFQ